jgi:flagellar biosynthesis protein FliP
VIKKKLIKLAVLSALLLPLCALSEPKLIDQVNNLLAAPSFSGRIIQIFLLIGVLGVAPSIFIMVTSFVRISIVLSIVRNAIGLQHSPPNQVLNALALFLTFFIMAPVAQKAYQDGLSPMLQGKLSEEKAVPLIAAPFKKFMVANTRAQDIDLFASIAKTKITDDLPLQVVVPAFIISELKKAFEIGFVLFLPFLVIDLLTSSILMSMGMMMMSPAMVSLPLKLIFFVLIDGWHLLAGSLVKGFSIL